MLITDPPGIDPSSLRDRMSGRVSAPGDLDWDEARQAWTIAVDQRPAAVAIPHSADDVIAIVDFANERGLRVTAQGTGHTAAAYDTLADTILVKMQEMRGVEMHERLVSHQRGRFTPGQLLAAGTVAGYRSLGWPGGQILLSASSTKISVSGMALPMEVGRRSSSDGGR